MHVYIFILCEFLKQLPSCYLFLKQLLVHPVMHEAGYVDYQEHLVPLLIMDINVLSILHHLGSPLG